MASPNILLIISDEHNARLMGCAGADFVRTPHLDRLARGGTMFDAAYCAFALCTPSRNSLMAGLECHKIRAYDIGSPLASDLPTWAHMLSRAGYRTPLYGKMHFLGSDQLHGFDEHRNEPPSQIDGFRWGEETGNGTGYKCFTPVHFTDNCKHNATFGNYTHDREMLASSLDFLDHAGQQNQPFCLTVGFNYPHYPLVVDRALFESYRGVPIPAATRGPALHPRNEHFAKKVWGYDRMSQEQMDAGRRAYLAMVTMLDEHVGHLLDRLQATGQAQNTLVIYTSDHGDMWGEHGMWGKNTFYEESARVPLIVSGPGIVAGRRIATPVSLLDLYPTLRDLVGAHDWNVPLDGRSLAGALRGGDLPAVPVFCSYYACDVRGPERMVRWNQYKLNYYHNWGLELFDLDRDPQELVNLVDDPQHKAIVSLLTAMLMRNWDPNRIDADIRVEQNRRTLLAEGLRKSRSMQTERTGS